MDKNKESFIEKVTAATEACEEVAEVLTSSAGMIVTRVTPLLAPVASDLCTLFAFYDGGGRMLDGHVPNPYTWSLITGIIFFIVIEGINFAATFTRDRSESLKEKHFDTIASLKLNNLVTWCFVLTFSSVAMLETLPGLVARYHGEISGADFGFRIGILILPWFSKMGASIFSASMVLDALEGTAAARRQRRLEEKKAAAQAEIEIETMRLEAAARIAQQDADAKQKRELERLKVEAKLKGNRSESVRKSVQISDLDSAEQEPDTESNSKPITPLDKVNAGRKQQRELGKAKMLEIYSVKPDASLREIGDQLGKSPSTISELLKELEGEQRVNINGQVHVR